MIQTIESPDIPFDQRQKYLQDELYQHVDTLEITSQIRYQNFQGLQGIVNIDRTALSDRATGQVDDLKGQVQTVGENVLRISTAAGSVDPTAGADYLEQELLRESLVEDLFGWLNRYKMYREYIVETLGDKAPRGNTEVGICGETLRILHGDLSDLSEEEEILRAAAILAEVQKQREQMGAALYAAPVHSLKAVAASIVSTVACFGVSAGVSLGLATTGAQYAHKGYDNFRQGRKLALPERNAKKLLRERFYSHRTCVQQCLSQLDIRGNPAEVVGYQA